VSLPNDKDNAQRVLSNPGVKSLVEQWNIWRRFILDPFLKMIADEDNIIHAPTRLSDVSFEARLSEVAIASLLDGSLIVFQPMTVSVRMRGACNALAALLALVA